MWTVNKITDHPFAVEGGEFDNGYLCHKDGNLQAIIEKRKATWMVWRIHKTRRGDVLGGADSFRTFDKAKSFVVDNPGVWGH